ncbi:CsgG/HfaB family protein [Pseudoponticoccus marisrubri]|uniref:Curlin n=1 Tax=Pseudoponticoccus marisrubri TaxID=1685382 RepID=A0A0W7WLJ1_9RHOB|nr:CsgG/HfaB family protein [Pseudoponticoccus marisrubri]KUF11468.1 hypothetical protein AVJ23_06800 [Pseudoponticoccus marisrubri]
MGLALMATMALAGCDTSLRDAYESKYAASVGMMTAQNRALRSIPLPHERVTVAVYGLPDLTGQYKEDDTGQNLSRAVTQAGAAVLIKALQDAGERRWFSVLDRSNLDNILRERQIVTEMRRIYRNESQIDPKVLGPLDHSGILIEGEITGYDTNTMTGGLGARYLGIGGHRRWKLDTVTVSLRAVSATTSEVLASVVVRKPIASYATQGNVFTYIALDELVEAEAGYAMNEPKQIAVEQAVEKAVMALVAEGAMAGLWKFKDHAAGQHYMASYTAQKFDGDVPHRALRPKAPNTRNTAIPATVPHRPVARPATVRRVSERRVAPVRTPSTSAPVRTAPAQRPTAPPDNPDSDEVVG